jgi:hypothetical protein
VFDEFQSITTIEGATAVLRTHLQQHYSELGLVFAGSAPSAMRDVFTRHDQPFFDQADLVTIEPLDLAAVHAIVGEGFGATGRDPGAVAGRIFALTGGRAARAVAGRGRPCPRPPAGPTASCATASTATWS